jgi:hypothetical protein
MARCTEKLIKYQLHLAKYPGFYLSFFLYNNFKNILIENKQTVKANLGFRLFTLYQAWSYC